MELRKKLRLAHLASLLLALVVVVWAHDGLPDRVATHFGVDGVADGWGSRSTSVILLCGTVVLSTLLLWGTAALVAVVPTQLMNIPNRSWWLAPERKDHTVALIGAWAYGFGALVNLFLAWVTLQVASANRATPPHLDGSAMWGGLVVFLTLALASVVALVLPFVRRPGR